MTPFICEAVQAHCNWLQEMFRQHNHTLEPLDLMRCPCGHYTILAKLPFERCRVVICEGCGDWHTVLFK